MPFADGSCCVAGILEALRKGHSGWIDNHGRITGQHTSPGFAEGILAGHQRIAAWRTGRGRRVGICKSDAFIGNTVDVWRFYLRSAICADVAVANIICEDKDHIGPPHLRHALLNPSCRLGPGHPQNSRSRTRKRHSADDSCHVSHPSIIRGSLQADAAKANIGCSSVTGSLAAPRNAVAHAIIR